jgi:hypothetical protein
MRGLANTFLVMPGGCASGRMRCAFPALRASRLGDLWFLIVIPESQSDIRDPATLHFIALRESCWVSAFAG